MSASVECKLRLSFGYETAFLHHRVVSTVMSTANGVSVCVVLFDVGFGGYGGGWEEYHGAGGDLLAIYINKKVWKLYETVL